MLTSSKRRTNSGGDMVDTLGIYRRLKRARASESVSREIAAIFGDVVESRLTTKQDLGLVRQEMAMMRSEFTANLADMSREFSVNLATTARDLSMNMVRMEKDLKVEIAQSRVEILRWVLGMLVTQSALLLAAIKTL